MHALCAERACDKGDNLSTPAGKQGAIWPRHMQQTGITQTHAEAHTLCYIHIQGVATQLPKQHAACVKYIHKERVCVGACAPHTH